MRTLTNICIIVVLLMLLLMSKGNAQSCENLFKKSSDIAALKVTSIVDLQEWFNTNYPGVKVQFVETPTINGTNYKFSVFTKEGHALASMHLHLENNSNRLMQEGYNSEPLLYFEYINILGKMNQSKGLGRVLTAHALNFARSKGIHALYIEFALSNHDIFVINYHHTKSIEDAAKSTPTGKVIDTLGFKLDVKRSSVKLIDAATKMYEINLVYRDSIK